MNALLNQIFISILIIASYFVGTIISKLANEERKEAKKIIPYFTTMFLSLIIGIEFFKINKYLAITLIIITSIVSYKLKETKYWQAMPLISILIISIMNISNKGLGLENKFTMSFLIITYLLEGSRNHISTKRTKKALKNIVVQIKNNWVTIFSPIILILIKVIN